MAFSVMIKTHGTKKADPIPKDTGKEYAQSPELHL